MEQSDNKQAALSAVEYLIWLIPMARAHIPKLPESAAETPHGLDT